MKKYPYFHFELKRQAKNWQGGVITDFCHISPRTVVENILIFNINLIFLGAGKNFNLMLVFMCLCVYTVYIYISENYKCICRCRC